MLALALLTSALTAEPTPRFVPPADFAAKAGEYMAARAAHRGFGGTVLVAHNGKVLFAAGYGLANRDHDVPNTVATKFRIGSITKQFTAACVLLLEQQGKLKVGDPLSKHLSDCPKAWADVTLHQLLSHTSGVPANHLLPATLSGKLPLYATPNQILGWVKDKPLQFKPGEKHVYSNTGYALLGMVIEKVSGKKYGAFLKDAILTPCGMADSGVDDTGLVLKDRATGYAGPDREGQFIHMTVVYSAGNMYSTVGDLLKWDRALAGDSLLGPPAKKMLFTEVKDGYAAGFVVGPRFGRAQQWHNGGLPGFTSMLIRFPDDGLFVTVLTNIDDGRPELTAVTLSAIAFGKPYVVPRKLEAAKLPGEALDKLAGKYTSGDLTMTVARSGDKLTFKGEKRAEVTYTPQSADRFVHATKTREAEAVFSSPKGKPPVIVERTTGVETRWVRAD